MKQIITPSAFLVAVGVGVGTQAARVEWRGMGYADAIAFGLFVVFSLWLLSNRREGVADGPAHESAGEKIALRLGKLLNRIRRRLKRGSISA